MSEDIKKWLPYAAGAVVIVVGFILWRRSGTNVSTGAQVVPAPDNSATVGAAYGLQGTQIAAASQAYGQLIDYAAILSTNEASLRANDQNLELARIQSSTDIQIANIDAGIQKRAISENSRTQRTGQILSTIGIIALAFFCYRDTESAQIAEKQEEEFMDLYRARSWAA